MRIPLERGVMKLIATARSSSDRRQDTGATCWNIKSGCSIALSDDRFVASVLA